MFLQRGRLYAMDVFVNNEDVFKARTSLTPGCLYDADACAPGTSSQYRRL